MRKWLAWAAYFADLNRLRRQNTILRDNYAFLIERCEKLETEIGDLKVQLQRAEKNEVALRGSIDRQIRSTIFLERKLRECEAQQTHEGKRNCNRRGLKNIFSFGACEHERQTS